MKDYSSYSQTQLIQTLHLRDEKIEEIQKSQEYKVYIKLAEKCETLQNTVYELDGIITELHKKLNKYRFLVGDMTLEEFEEAVDKKYLRTHLESV